MNFSDLSLPICAVRQHTHERERGRLALLSPDVAFCHVLPLRLQLQLTFGLSQILILDLDRRVRYAKIILRRRRALRETDGDQR
jgi:hypothetical protein